MQINMCENFRKRKKNDMYDLVVSYLYLRLNGIFDMRIHVHCAYDQLVIQRRCVCERYYVSVRIRSFEVCSHTNKLILEVCGKHLYFRLPNTFSICLDLSIFDLYCRNLQLRINGTQSNNFVCAFSSKFNRTEKIA